MKLINWRGVSSSKRMILSVKINDESNIARASSLFTGLFSPFNRRTEESVFSPIISLSPSSAAFARYSTCPRCSISKHPFVKTIFLSL